MATQRRTWIALGVGAWLVLVGVGVRTLHGYSTTPGARAATPASWPRESALPRGAGPTAVMFVHPACPCSKASVAELAKVARTAGAPSRIVVVLVGEDTGDVAAVSGTTRVLDPDRREATRFGALTSGHVVVYDASGALRFSGGITGSRGHQGDNIGARRVQTLLAGGATATSENAVFGCAFPEEMR
jgi:hypothetical protein